MRLRIFMYAFFFLLSATLAHAGAAIPVHTGAAQPLAQDWVDAHHVHGEDGLGGAPRPDRTAEVAGSDAVGFLVSTLSAAAATADPVDLLMIGPLTNLALALQRAPGITGGIGRLVIMGGTIHGRGNVTPAAEFNIFSDPEAAAMVFGAAIDKVVSKLAQQLRKRKTKLVSTKKHKTQLATEGRKRGYARR